MRVAFVYYLAFVVLSFSMARADVRLFPVSAKDTARYTASQQLRRELDSGMAGIVRDLIHPKYLNDPEVFGDFLGRCSTGTARTTMIDEERGLYPERGLVKLGRGGDRCIVTYGSFDPKGGRTYAHCIEKMITSLKNTEFDGYLYYRKGGYPEPEGWELGYADLSYAFKPAMLKEAHALGFSSCLWIDAPFMANKSPDHLFRLIEREGGVFNLGLVRGRGHKRFEYELDRFCFPRTVSVIEEFVGSRIDLKITANVFGLRMNDERSRIFLEKYDEMVRMRSPFYSCFPEEFVLSALLSLPMFRSWPVQLPFVLGVDCDESLMERRGEFYFSRLLVDRPDLDFCVPTF